MTSTHLTRYSSDEPTEVLYQDVARNDVEGRVGNTRELMTGWVEEAKRRRPCLLILDGLDVMLRQENEVKELSYSIVPGVLILCS